MKYKCFRCKHELIWGNDFMQSDLEGEELKENEDSLVSFYTCPYCGMSYMITDTAPEDQKDFPYFKKKKTI